MTKIKLSDTGFTLIPEGLTVFKVVEVKYDEDFGTLEVSLQTKSGQKHIERFSLITATGEVNEGANKAFSYFAKTALNNYNLDEIDDQDLVGCYIKANVVHEEYESKKEKGRMLKTARLKNYEVAVGFGNESTAPDSDIELGTVDESDDLDALDELDDLM